jgi:hypothetical protein
LQKVADLGVAFRECEVTFGLPELLHEEGGREISTPEQIGMHMDGDPVGDSMPGAAIIK